MIRAMKTVSIALFLTVVLAAPAVAHRSGNTMLEDAAVNHDLEKAKRQFKKIVQQDEAGSAVQTR
jgi:hypothetical protein